MFRVQSRKLITENYHINIESFVVFCLLCGSEICHLSVIVDFSAGSISAAGMGLRTSMQPQETEDLPSPSKDDSPVEAVGDNDFPDSKSTRQSSSLTPEVTDIIAKKPPTIVLDPTGSTLPGSAPLSPKDRLWQRQLTLRTCINMSSLGKKGTAGSGVNSTVSGGNQGAKSAQLTVTALAFSKDHKALHVGDSLGRVTTLLSGSGE